MKKRKLQWSQWIGSAVMVLIGIACGIILAESPSVFPADNTWGKLQWLVGLLAAMYIAMLIHMILHEAGHLLFGHLTGYRFSSFRILSHIWIRQDGKLCHRRLSIAGTGGQCLMSPPPIVDGKLPVVLYNLGGSLSNIFVGSISLGLYFLCMEIPFLSAILLIFALVGFLFGLLNGIPMRLGTVDNDGYNAWALTRSPAAMRAFWVQMKVNQMISGGQRLKDMPEEWFELPEGASLMNSMVAVLDVFACNRLMDQHDFAEADKQMERLLGTESGIVGLHRCMLLCDRLYMELIGPNRPEAVASFMTKHQQRFMASMKDFPPVLRTQYVYALLAEKDNEKAAQILHRFEKAAATYPYPNEVAAERELIEIAQNT